MTSDRRIGATVLCLRPARGSMPPSQFPVRRLSAASMCPSLTLELGGEAVQLHRRPTPAAVVSRLFVCNAVVLLVAAVDDAAAGEERVPISGCLPVEWVVDAFMEQLRFSVATYLHPADAASPPLEAPPADGPSDEEDGTAPRAGRRLLRRFSASPAFARPGVLHDSAAWKSPTCPGSPAGALLSPNTPSESPGRRKRGGSATSLPFLRVAGLSVIRLLLHIVNSIAARCPPVPPLATFEALDAAVDADGRFADAKLIVLVSGASGSGKSTLSNTLADRLQVATVCSSDHIRHLLRVFYDKKDKPLLFASTYETDQFVSETDDTGTLKSTAQRALEGYLAQCAMVEDRLVWLVKCILERGESAIIEGVHLTRAVADKIKLVCRQHQEDTMADTLCVPFIVKVDDPKQHIKRFAGRTRNFATDPESNKYVRNIEKIRAVQRYLCTEGIRSGAQLVDNDSLPQALQKMHSTVISKLLSHRRPSKRCSFAL